MSHDENNRECPWNTAKAKAFPDFKEVHKCSCPQQPTVEGWAEVEREFSEMFPTTFRSGNKDYIEVSSVATPPEYILSFFKSKFASQITKAKEDGYKLRIQHADDMLKMAEVTKIAEQKARLIREEERREAHFRATVDERQRILRDMPARKNFRSMYSNESKGLEREDFAAGYNSAIEEVRDVISRGLLPTGDNKQV